MIHYFEGQLGHAFAIIAFVSSLLAAYAFFKGRNQDAKWTAFGAKIFYVHSFAILGIIGTLFYLITNHYFEYHYVFSHSSKILPVYYQISCFWEGQEGSFLLWMFWNAVLGIILINTNKFWKAPVMLIMSLTQVFLASMILGVVIFEVKLGSSPFMLLREVIDAPIFKTNPNFIPEDGNGLNPLLQNYWMVIHPPTLFLGFATTVIPFAYCIGGLIIGKNKEWIRPALPWAQFSAMILGVGILMGAYWAYETLNFGGYWNWDPVENAIYIPWLVLVAAIHVMIAYKKSGSALKLSMILVVASFILVLYATFLTRSGILGNSSVHSFTDLGLSGQLLIYLLVFITLSVFFITKRWREIPATKEETSTYSREFWIFMGASVLCLMAFQVLIYTSMPVYNQIANFFGFDLNLAPPTDIYDAYSLPQMILAIFLAILSGTGQFFWWKKMDRKKLKAELTTPFIISLVISGLVIVIAKITNPYYLILLVTCVYSITANAKIFIGVAKSNIKLSGGSITHIGVALMLVGILFSSGYSTILSTNYTSMVWSTEFPEEVNRDNLLLFINEPRQMKEYSMIYRGIRKETREDGYVDQNELTLTPDPLKVIKNGTDTLTLISPENSFFEVEYHTKEGKEFTLFPRVQINQAMDMIVYSPDIKRKLSADMYTHVRTFPDPDQEPDWSEPKEIKVEIGDQFFINDYVATLERMEPIAEIDGTPLNQEDVAVKAVIEVQGEYKNYLAEPIFVIRNREFVGRIDDQVDDLAFRISIQNILPQENAVLLAYQTTQKDWIIMEAVKKPWINLLWIGTFLLVIGFVVAIRRRYLEFVKMRDKGVEA
ncbi:cytochrome c-type biogenesis protein CcmF [Ekhidna lutea]|uniref:Cytochrome c-type biogenesis protein CcmF n=1 Tax=Ekhidna lutea TaxID=447679 RepID=A0A239FEP8_EKHLU|nr:cytochrome c biogenesis protein CcsA [Ekhidna lutea]SNS55235.1 cytochrome c-type biogenesis protein CcmF [Ekhidna lutea]